MIPSDRSPGAASPEAPSDPPPERGTLPPPEWGAEPTRAARSTDAPLPLERRAGPRAEEAWMRARVEEARAGMRRGDDGTELRERSATLARWLASRDRDLDEACDLATGALHIGEDVELRRELAAWLESLGETGRAAVVLRPIASLPDVESAEAAYVLVRAGVLKARSGAAAGAVAAFEAAMPIEPDDAVPAELLGAVAAWEPEAVEGSAAAEAYVEAARRHAAQQHADAELEDLWRAVAIDPASEVAGEALAVALERRGRVVAADEARRALARALALRDPERAARVHARRRSAALAAQDPTRALGAALDAAHDTRLEGEDAESFDGLLLDLGMLEALAARMSARAARAPSASARARAYVELSRLYGGPLADEARAVSACVSALAADPGSEEAIAALRALIGDAMRALDAVGEGRLEPVRGMAESVAGVTDEGERRARIAARARTAVPALSEGEGSGDAPATSRAESATSWVRAVVDGDVQAQAVALERVASTASTSVRAVLLSTAAGRHAQAGHPDEAKRAAEAATRTDTTNPRCVAALADAYAHDTTRPGAAALERAISLVGPRVEWCRAIALALDALGEQALAIGWSQRLVALRPGDRDAITGLVQRLRAGADAGRLGDALTWLLSQPHAASWLAPLFAGGLAALAQGDVDRAAVVARRALDVFGPRCAPLRDAMLEVATRASDDPFAAAVLERWLATGAEGADRSALYSRLADVRQRLRDDEGVARILARAAREGVRSAELDAHREGLGAYTLVGDALLWLLRAKAEAAPGGPDVDIAVSAWRDLGAALWDLAEDRVGAIAVWQRAARIAPSRGHVTMALDLVAFAGTPFAFEYLSRLIETEPEAPRAGLIGADVARAALRVGEPHLALDLAARGLARAPSCAEALEVAERAADRSHEHASLSALYELVASRSLGRFGRRAAHHRGARFFERRGEHALALKHAAQAFYAVPSEGSSFQLLARAAERAGDRLHAVRTIEHVAESAAASSARAGWLLRAASIAGEGEEGARRRVEVLLRAAVASPTVGTIALLTDAARDLVRFSPEERDVVELRVARAARAITDRLDGPDGARIGLAFGMASIDLFSDPTGALASPAPAFRSDGDIDEFTNLVPHAGALAQATDAQARVGAMLDVASSPHANVGVAALRLFSSIATALGDVTLRARASVAAASREPDDDGLVVEADAAVRAAPEQAEALAKRVPDARRAEALLATARALVGNGGHAEAAPLFERAVGLVTGDARLEVEGELRAAWDAAGRGSEIEARVQREAASDAVSPTTRADRWTEVAERREARGDAAGAVTAQTEACRLDPESLERWSALERLAELAGDDVVRVAALEQIAKKVSDDGRVSVFKRLARAHERRGDLEAALRTWHLVLALDADDEAADQAIEATIVSRGRYDELVDHLARRAERLSTHSGTREVLRAVRLRRAAILEQRLGRLSEACDELALLLNEWPDNVGALRYLADLLDRQGEPARAAPLWRQAAALEPNGAERDVLELRAGRASRAAGDVVAAAEHANRVLARHPTHPEALALSVDVARALGSDRQLADALDAMASSDPIEGTVRADLLVEAAHAAARMGEGGRALDRARRAASSAPERAAPQLMARGLEYRHRGAGTPSDARRTVEELSRIREPLARDDDALRAFLAAEALDAVQGGGAGFHELEATQAVIGEHPLLALGLAERLVAQGRHRQAVEQYRVALQGPLLELRHPASVALAASDAALRAERPEDATAFLELARAHPGAQEAVRTRTERLSMLVAATRQTTLEPPPPVAAGEAHEMVELEAALRAAEESGTRAQARFSLARARLERGDQRGAEPLLWEALADGVIEAGDLLAPTLAGQPERTRDLVRIRRQQASLEPGDYARLESLRVAAAADDDRVYARAVEHVLRAFDPGAGPLPPPPLASQPAEVEMLALLARPATDAMGEALAVLWEGSAQLFARDAQSYGITGVERVVPGSSSVIARLYEVALRALGSPRIPLFVPRSTSGTPAAHVAVLSPPSVILAGDVKEETTELRFALGRGMAAAMPHNVLRLGLPPAEARAALDAMRAAFGPPEAGRHVDLAAARLAESFWQVVPQRAQRRLQELLAAGPTPEYEELVARAHQAGRRVGLFLCGDFAHAARVLMSESPGRTGLPLPSPSTLGTLCRALPAMADLLRVAVSPEYAQARWHSVAPAAPRGTMSSGRFSAF